MPDHRLCLANPPNPGIGFTSHPRRLPGPSLQRQDGFRREDHQPGGLHERPGAHHRRHVGLRHGRGQERRGAGGPLRYLRFAGELRTGGGTRRPQPPSACPLLRPLRRQRPGQAFHPAEPDEAEHRRDPAGMEGCEGAHTSAHACQFVGAGDCASSRVGRFGLRHRNPGTNRAGGTRTGRLPRTGQQRSARLRHRHHRAESRRGTATTDGIAAVRQQGDRTGGPHHQVTHFEKVYCQGAGLGGRIANRLPGRYSGHEQA